MTISSTSNSFSRQKDAETRNSHEQNTQSTALRRSHTILFDEETDADETEEVVIDKEC